jgi:hypothetical protein
MALSGYASLQATNGDGSPALLVAWLVCWLLAIFPAVFAIGSLVGVLRLRTMLDAEHFPSLPRAMSAGILFGAYPLGRCAGTGQERCPRWTRRSCHSESASSAAKAPGTQWLLAWNAVVVPVHFHSGAVPQDLNDTGKFTINSGNEDVSDFGLADHRRAQIGKVFEKSASILYSGGHRRISDV